MPDGEILAMFASDLTNNGNLAELDQGVWSKDLKRVLQVVGGTGRYASVSGTIEYVAR